MHPSSDKLELHSFDGFQVNRLAFTSALCRDKNLDGLIYFGVHTPSDIMLSNPLTSLVLVGQVCCLLIGGLYLRVWLKDRVRWDILFFSLTAFSLVGYANGEIQMMHAQSVDGFVRLLYWQHFFVWFSHVFFGLFVWFHFKAGNSWILWSGLGLRTVAFIISLLSQFSINFTEITGLKHIDFYGETLSIPVGTRNPLMVIAHAGTFLILIYCIITAVSHWRRGKRRDAAWFGGTVVIFVGGRFADVVLVMWGLVDFPLTSSPFFMGIVLSMAWELSSQAGRVQSLEKALVEKDVEAHKLLAELRVAEYAGHVGVWVREVATNRFMVSNEWREIFEYPGDEAITLEHVIERVHPDDLARLLDARPEIEDSTDAPDLVFRIVLPSGRERWVQSLRRVEKINGVASFVYGAIADITERRRAESAASDLGGLLIGAMETERARLARELHDDLSQRIALLSIKLHMLDTSTEAAIAEQVHSLSANIEEISNEVRRLSHQLHPSTLEQLGLESALRGFCRELNEAHKIKITLDCDSLPQTLSKNISLCMFRITQEALRNVVKHSGADAVTVTVRIKEDTLNLTVADDGEGFDPFANASRSSLGLISMNERVAALGGSLNIDSAVGKGTRIGASIDLSRVRRR